MKTKSFIHKLAAVLTIAAIFLFTAALPLTAYAAPEDNPTDTTQSTDTTTSETATDIPAESNPPAVIVPNGANPPHEATGNLIGNDFTFDDEQTGKQFVVFKTASGKVFYLIIDHDKTTDNVYLLTEVGEDDLLNFVDENGNPVVPGTVTVTPGGSQTTAPENPDKPANQSNAGLIVLIIVVLGAGGAAFYFFKVKKGGKNKPFANAGDFDFDESEDDYEEPAPALTDDETEGEDE